VWCSSLIRTHDVVCEDLEGSSAWSEWGNSHLGDHSRGVADQAARAAATYYAERMLARPPILVRLGGIASLAHERCDGSGYHRGLAWPAIPATGRILAAACAYRAT
jgi:HD-GYP domain-containing protein (c-di-GMP phosphodiesterase class II)